MNRGLEKNPLAGELPDMRTRYGAETSLGRTLRKGDAKLLLQRMQEAEAAVEALEDLNRQISDRIARISAEHELNMQYLMQFGVSADERAVFQQLLAKISQHGGLTLDEAAVLSRAQLHAETSRTNQTSGEESAV